MKISLPWFPPVLVALALFHAPSVEGQTSVRSRAADIPEALRPWQAWAVWDDRDRECPAPYQDAKQRLPFWPSTLSLQVDKAGGRFDLTVSVFREGWVPLPGGAEQWPFDVKDNGVALPVVGADGVPQVKLAAGTHRLQGAYRWSDVPQRLALPAEIGLLSLTLEGKAVEVPAWDAEGYVWLRRDASTEEVDKDFLGVKLFGALEDGIPLWLRLEVELSVAGKSREEDIGVILPAGWKLAAVESPIPVAVDDAGRMKAQVRAGKWTVRADAFRVDNPKSFQFAEGVKPASEELLLAFRAQPEFRLVEITGVPSVDVSQTAFPDKWRNLPVYRWETGGAFAWEERMRGMGLQKPAGLSVQRQLWLDDDGRGLTFRDVLSGAMQQTWRLDADEGQVLGSVRAAGQGQLITRNPAGGASGVEIRSRNVALEATGRVSGVRDLSASGWKTDADGVGVTLNLPPGWRLFGVFGADWVRGDWLTAWTLLDLFLLLIFSLAVFRMWGFVPAVVAFLAFGLSYHEPNSPRYAWLALLVPLGLLRVVPEGWLKRGLLGVKWIAALVLVLILVPFVAHQVQQCLYPQLEVVASSQRGVPAYGAMSARGGLIQGVGAADSDSQDFSPPNAPAPVANDSVPQSRWAENEKISGKPGKGKDGQNLSYDTKARIQTGPGVPEWTWRQVSYGWSGPVQAGQRVRPVLISRTMERGITIVRVALLLALAALLLRGRRAGGPGARPVTAAAAAVMMLFACVGSASAQSSIPNADTIKLLRQRLLETPDVPAIAADIPSVSLTLRDRKLVIESEIHCGARTAVPLPGRLPAWSPVSVTVDGKPDAVLRRDDGHLWVVLSEGVHRVRVEGRLSQLTEWEWTFHLKPHRVSIDAPDWTVSGVRPDGTPEAQVFFAQKQRTSGGEATYERQDLQSLVAVERSLELGLVWQVRTRVTRLSPVGKAVALRIPLLPGENVMSSGSIVKDGVLDVRLGAQDESFTWDSELTVTNAITLATRPDDTWVERWKLVASPVWNVSLSGLSPVFEADGAELVPSWSPWPGERVECAVGRPEAVAGATVTVNSGRHTIALGKRQHTSTLELSLRCSLGEEFVMGLPAGAEVTALKHDNNTLPVRLDGGRLTVPLHPGEQKLVVTWKVNEPLGFRSSAGQVVLPVDAANITTVIQVPRDRWVLGTHGPLRGPAVRFWVILACALLAALVLGRLPQSPLRTVEWLLLAVGLTQVPLPAALLVVGWLFFLAWRGHGSFLQLRRWQFNTLQIAAAGVTLAALGVFVAVVAEGLLGNPEMFIGGNGSSPTSLRWYQDRTGTTLPQPGCLSVSIWWYRLLMLAWALWLAAALIRWLRWGWGQITTGGWWKSRPPRQPGTPPAPPAPPALPAK